MAGAPRRSDIFAWAFGLALLASSPRALDAAPLIPGPADPDYHPTLSMKAKGYDRQFHTFNASPFGLSLDAFVPDADDRAALVAFLTQDATRDFAAFTTQMG